MCIFFLKVRTIVLILMHWYTADINFKVLTYVKSLEN